LHRSSSLITRHAAHDAGVDDLVALSTVAPAHRPPLEDRTDRPASDRWKHIVAGVGTLLVILLIALVRCRPGPPSNAVVVPRVPEVQHTPAD
jgi:hypothetical protein